MQRGFVVKSTQSLDLLLSSRDVESCILSRETFHMKALSHRGRDTSVKADRADREWILDVCNEAPLICGNRMTIGQENNPELAPPNSVSLAQE